MIKGVGVDIIEIKRLKEAVKKWGDSFLNRVFTEDEIKYSNSKKFPFQHLAARFAVKEAVFKALGDALIEYKDIEVVNDINGKPRCKLLRAVKGIKNKDILISISHGKDYAVAQAVIAKKS